MRGGRLTTVLCFLLAACERAECERYYSAYETCISEAHDTARLERLWPIGGVCLCAGTKCYDYVSPDWTCLADVYDGAQCASVEDVDTLAEASESCSSGGDTGV